MTDEPDIIKQLREEEKLGLLHSKTGSTHELKFVKQPPGEIPERNLVFIEPDTVDSTMDDTLCNIFLDDLYKAAFELSPDCIIILDLHGIVQTCNTVTVAKLGWQKQEIIGKHISKIGVFRKNDILERLKSFSAVLGGRDIVSFETEIVCRDGSSFFAEVRPILLKKDGKNIGVLAIWRDITKNKKINQTLHRYETIIKTIKHPMSLIDTNYVYQTVNDAYLPFLNKSREEIEGHSVEEVLGKEFFEKQVKPYFDRCLTGDEVRYQVSFSTPGKEKRILEVEAYPYFDSDGAISGVVANTIDLTDQKKTEEEIKKERDKAQQYLDIAGVMFVALNSDGVVTLINKKGCEILGYAEEEVVGKNWFDTFVPKRTKDVILPVSKLLLDGEVKSAEYFENSILTKDGEERLIIWHNTIIKDDNGDIIGHLSSGADITEQKKTEERIVQSEKKYRELANSLPQIVYETDEHANFTFVNQASLSLTGYTEEDFKGLNALQTITPVDRARAKNNILKLLQGETITSNEYLMQRKDGSTFPALFHSTPILHDNKIVGLRGFAIDITEQKQVEGALRESEVRFRELFNRMSSGVVVYEAIDNGGDFIFRDFNLAAERIEKVSRKDILGRRVSEVFPGVKAFGVFEVFQRVWQTGKPEYYPANIYKDERDPGSWRENWVFKLPTGEIVAIYNNITERKKAEEALREGDEKWSSLTGNTNDIIMMVDSKGIIQYINKTLPPYTPKETIGNTLYEYVPKDHHDIISNSLTKVFKTGESDNYEMSSNIPKIGTIWFSTKVVPIKHNGEVTDVILISTDITNRKRAEVEIKASEQKLQTVFASSPDPIFSTDLTGNITECNQATLDFIGIPSKEELFSTPVLSMLTEDHRDKIAEQMMKCIDSGNTIKDAEYTFIAKNGRKIDSLVAAAVLKDASGNPTGFMAVVKDITERKRAELLERALYEIARAPETVKNLNDLYHVVHLIIKGLMPAENFYVCLYDEKEDLLHYPYFVDEIDAWPQPEKPGKGLTAYVLRTGRTLLCDTVLDKELVRCGEVEMVGSPSACWLGAPLKVGEKIIGIIALQHYSDSKAYGEREKQILDFVSGQIANTIERKRAEEESQRMQELLQIVNRDLERKVQDRTAEIRSLLNQKDEFINQLGHDLKNPLTPLTTLLPILRKEASDTVSLEQFDVVIRNVEYMKNLVIKTLELAQLNSSNTILSLEDINLTKKINDTLITQRLMFQTKHITVDNKIPETIIVQADNLCLEELLKNLLTNAVKYTPEGGSITLNAKPEKECVTISIQDTGIGLTKEQTAHIFDEFYKVDQSRHDFDSSGLGLPICKRIAEKHGGKIWAVSEGLGKGTTLYFTLPRVQRNTESITNEKIHREIDNVVYTKN